MSFGWFLIQVQIGTRTVALTLRNSRSCTVAIRVLDDLKFSVCCVDRLEHVRWSTKGGSLRIPHKLRLKAGIQECGQGVESATMREGSQMVKIQIWRLALEGIVRAGLDWGSVTDGAIAAVGRCNESRGWRNKQKKKWSTESSEKIENKSETSDRSRNWVRVQESPTSVSELERRLRRERWKSRFHYFILNGNLSVTPDTCFPYRLRLTLTLPPFLII